MRNDSGLPTADVVSHLQTHGVRLKYGDIELMVEKSALEKARAEISALQVEDRQKLLASVDRALRRALPKLKKPNFKKRTADNFYQDLVLWEVLRSSDMV